MTILYPTRIKKNNLGDILINVLLVRELTKNCFVMFDDRPDRSFLQLVSHQNPYSDRLLYPVKRSVFKGKPVFRWISVFQQGRKIHMVFDPPGHYFGKDSFTAFLKGLKNTARAWILRLLNIRMARIGVTMGPFGKRSLQWQEYIARFYTVTGVRDLQNFEDLKKIHWPNLSFFDDLSFLYDDKLTGGENNYALPVEGNFMLLSFRHNLEGHRMDKEYFDTILKSIQSLVSQLIQPGWNIIITHQVEEDLEASLAIQQQLTSIGIEAMVIEKQLDLAAACSLYNNAELVLTNRLHVALLALLNNTAAYALTDIQRHPKLVNLYYDLQLEDLLIDVDHHANWVYEPLQQVTALRTFAQMKIIKQQTMQDQVASLLKIRTPEPMLNH